MIRCVQGEHIIKPFSVVTDLASGALGRNDWVESCAACGIAGVDLGMPHPS